MSATFRYYFDGKEVTGEEWEKLHKKRERSLRVSGWKKPFYRLSHSDSGDFRGETDPATGRQGRYMPQYARYLNDPKAVFLSVKDAKKEAARRGWTVIG